MFYKKISDNLTRWGKKSQKISPNNDIIKQNVLNSLRPTLEETKTKHHFTWRWLMVAAVPALAVLLMISYNKTMREIPISYVENQFDTGLTSESSIAGVGGDFGIMAASHVGLGESESLSEKIVNTVSEYTESFRFPSPKTVDITDTREYLKTNFGLDIKTRKVEKMHTRLKTMIRGYDGRIDSANLNERYANINFVLPKSTYESFIEEATEMFPEKFITLHENSTNLLGQKQNIEQQTEYASTSLDNLKMERTDNIKKYDEKYASLNKEISRLQRIMENIVEQRKTVSSTEKETIKKLDDQLNDARQTHNDFVSELLRTMTQHEKDLENFDNQIKNVENNLIELGKQDTQLINDVETVNGTITLRFISLFEIVNLYIPVYKTIIIICILIIIGYFLFGRKQKEIELP